MKDQGKIYAEPHFSLAVKIWIFLMPFSFFSSEEERSHPLHLCPVAKATKWLSLEFT